VRSTGLWVRTLDSFFVKPDDIADTALMLTRQKPSAWTFELEARPFGETW
jgi:hypothetical protein